MGKSQDNFYELVFSVHNVGPGMTLRSSGLVTITFIQ